MSRDVIIERLRGLEGELKQKSAKTSSRVSGGDRGFASTAKGSVPSTKYAFVDSKAQEDFAKRKAGHDYALTEMDKIIETIVSSDSAMVSRVFDLFKSHTDITLYEELNDAEDGFGIKFKEIKVATAEDYVGLTHVTRDLLLDGTLSASQDLTASGYSEASFAGGGAGFGLGADDSSVAEAGIDTLSGNLAALDRKKIFIGGLLKSNYDLLTIEGGLSKIMRETALSEAFNANNENLLKAICDYNKTLLKLIEIKNSYHIGAVKIDPSSYELTAEINNTKLTYELHKQEAIEATKKELTEAKSLLDISASFVAGKGGILSMLGELLGVLGWKGGEDDSVTLSVIEAIDSSRGYKEMVERLFLKIKRFIESGNVKGLDGGEVASAGAGEGAAADGVADLSMMIKDEIKGIKKAFQADIADNLAHLRLLKKTNDRVEEERNVLRDENGLLLGAIAALESEVASLREQISSTGRTPQKTLDRAGAGSAAGESPFSSILSPVSISSMGDAAVAEENAALKAENAALREELDAFRVREGAKDSQLEELAAESGKMREEIASLNKKIIDIAASNSRLKSKLAIKIVGGDDVPSGGVTGGGANRLLKEGRIRKASQLMRE